MARTYNELVAKVELLIDRTDASQQASSTGVTINQLDEFITNAERRFYRDEVARIPPLERTVVYSVTAGQSELAIPSDYLELNYAVANNSLGSVTMMRSTVEHIQTRTDNRVSPLPSRIAYGSNVWQIDPPTTDCTITVYYYRFLNDLSTVTSDTTAHWLLNRADDLIMYWAGVEASLYFGSIDTEMRTAWEAKAQDIKNAIIEQEIRQRDSGSTPMAGRFYRIPRQVSPNVGNYS